MSPLSKKQAFTSIRDIILISLFIYVIEEYALSVENAQVRYLFIALIIISFLYCILKFLSALLSSSIIVIRIGSYEDNNEVQDYRTINWSSIPPGKDLYIRMSGLVWPEAAQRIANSAYLTRERVGKGQIILFSGEPNFRGSARGTNRLWLNAVVYGAGLGTASRIIP